MTGKNYIFPFLNTVSEELKVQISESLAGIWITPPSFYLPTMMKIVNCPSCPIFWKFIDNFFLLYCDLYGCGLSVYSSATAVGVCLSRIYLGHGICFGHWNMISYFGCENFSQCTICKNLIVLMKLSIYDWHYNILDIQNLIYLYLAVKIVISDAFPYL